MKKKFTIGQELYSYRQDKVLSTKILAQNKDMLIIEVFNKDHGRAVIDKSDINSSEYGYWTDKKKMGAFMVDKKIEYIKEHQKEIDEIVRQTSK